MRPTFPFGTIVILAFMLFLNSVELKGQLRGTNLSEFQWGNLPDTDPSNMSSLFSQTNLSYRQKPWLIKAKIQQFYPSDQIDDRGYTQLSQFQVQYANNGFKLQVGHLYQTLGRGLLLRNYEMPGSIWETRSYRVRYGFYKDTYGVAAAYTKNGFKVKLLRGKVLAVDLPPTLSDEERRPDLIEGGEMSYEWKGQQIGFIGMRHHNNNTINTYYASFLNGSLGPVGYYGEIALDGKEAHGAYLGLNFSQNWFSLSAEYKDYKNFLLGAGINDPPTLVKEHGSRLLNRSTHIPVLTDEKGFQIEANFTLNNGGILSVNHAQANNPIGDNSYRFIEYYLEYQQYFTNSSQVKGFLDLSQDPFNAEPFRYTGGIQMEVPLGNSSLTWEGEIQSIQREGFEDTKINNYASTLSFQKGSKFSAGFVVELSSDPFLITEESKIKAYPALIASFQIEQATRLSIFIGERRGGPACNSGVCYDVLDFRGIELRLNTNF